MDIQVKRTATQNRALHLWFELLAEELNRAGLDMRLVLKPEVSIPWNKQTVKDYLWRPIQKAQLGKKSTTELTTAEIDKVFDTITLHLGEKFGKWCDFIPFPSIESMMDKLENEELKLSTDKQT
jgi:hypothetical protein